MRASLLHKALSRRDTEIYSREMHEIFYKIKFYENRIQNHWVIHYVVNHSKCEQASRKRMGASGVSQSYVVHILSSNHQKMRISKKNLERLEKWLDIIPSEAMEWEAFTLFLYWRMVDIESKDAWVLEFSHIPNGTWSKNGGVNINLKKQWVRKWSPDYYIAIRNTHCEESLIFIELKRIDWGDGWSDEQKRMIKILDSIPNVAAHFAFWAEQAIEILERYIDI